MATSSWDKTVQYWDTRSPTPSLKVSLPERAYAMDVRYPLMVVATAERHIVIYDLKNPSVAFKQLQSPLKHQSRCVSCFPDSTGYCLGSIEGRVAVQHVEDRDANKNFAFKCHRDSNDIYSVNHISFHPTYGTFATTGADGTYNFWDKDSRQRLKAFNRGSLPITCGAFNKDGTIFSYAASYDWSTGAEGYTTQTNHVLLHAVPEGDMKSRGKKFS